METTYLIRNSTTDAIIASGLPRDNALDLLGMLMAWNKGIQAWTVQVDYCEEEANCLQDDERNGSLCPYPRYNPNPNYCPPGVSNKSTKKESHVPMRDDRD